jgi:hypothetical protein
VILVGESIRLVHDLVNQLVSAFDLPVKFRGALLGVDVAVHLLGHVVRIGRSDDPRR